MNQTQDSLTSRREFIKNTGKIAAASALAGVAIPHVHAAENNTIQVALVGCGNRGAGAAGDALSVKNGPIKLVAMADVFEHRLKGSYEALKRSKDFGKQVEVPEDRKFIGFDAYKKAMDCLKPGDVAIFATPLAFRWVHFTYAIKKGLNVFMEKPLTADGPTSRRMLKLAEEAAAKNLKAGVGLMSRHSRALQELYQRIQDGEIGDLILLRGYRMHGPVGSAFSEKWPGKPTELLWQIQRFHSFLWASGGCFSDFYVHGRCINGCNDIYSSYAQGSKGMAIVSHHSDCGLPSSTYKGQNPERSNLLWVSKVNPDQQNPYQNEWNDLIDAIRNDKPYNEVKRGVEASLVTSLGRMAAHTGQEITFEEMLNSDHEYAPGVDKLSMGSSAPLRADSNGKYPVPEPGIKKKREF